MKRLVDVVAAALGLVLLSPVLALVALAVWLGSGTPVLYRQQRVGRGFQSFWLYKFRTMQVHAEAAGPGVTVANDPRVTRLGRILRSTKLDELPQLFNVLKGDMSLVGPRPLPLRDCDLISVRAHKRRFSVKPCIACLWQVNGREPSFDDWIRNDMEYIDHWSLGLDLKILVKTIPTILSGRGAY